MNIPYQVFIALRYLKSKKRLSGLSLNTAISIGGVALGVMALLVVISVMSGFHEDLQKKILGVNAHVVLFDYKGNIGDYKSAMSDLSGISHVAATSPFILGQVMVSSGDRSQGVVFKGIDPSYEEKTTDVKNHIKEGRFDDLDEKDGLPGIMLGRELTLKLGVIVGDKVRIMSPMGKIGPMGVLPKFKDFRVSGIFEIGMFEYDSNLVLVGMKSAQDFLEIGDAVTGLEIKLDDIYKASLVRKDIEKKNPDYYSRDWMQMNKNLFAALNLEKLVMFVILTLIVLVAAFNIVSTLTMTVMEKQREIAILRAMGATRQGIMFIFILQGFLIGLTGTFMGLAGGYTLGYVINTYEIIKLPADVYYLSRLPVKMKLVDFLSVSISAVIISFLATVYPAWQASRLNPVEPLRYE